jgi:hypothetical protein
MLTTINTHWGATQRVMAAKLTRLTHKIAIQLHLVSESCTIRSSRSRWPVRKLLDATSYTATGCMGCTIGVRVPLGPRIVIRNQVQTGSGAHPASYPMDTGSSIPGDKAAGAWTWPITSI